MSDTPRSGRPLVFDEDRLNKIYNDPRQRTRELANVMNCDDSTIVRHLYSMENVFKKSGVWVPHALSQNHKNQRVVICASLLARRRAS